MKRLLAAVWCGLAASAAVAQDCVPDDGLDFVCGPVASEDLVHVPGTPWLIASGLRTDGPGHLYRIDTRNRRAEAMAVTIRPDPLLGKDCPGPPDLSLLSVDGLALRTSRGGRHRLYAANHGDRQAIEIFEVGAGTSVVRVAWIGCIVMPEGTLANAVAPLPDDGIVISSFYDPHDPLAWTRMARGEATGSLWEWQSGRGLQRLDGGAISGPNGLALSADGRILYVSAWSGRAMLAIDRETGNRRTIPLDFLPDNIKRSADDTLLVAGQATEVGSIAACQGSICPQPWVVARVDPRSGNVLKLVSREGNATVSYACGALEVEDTLYITARARERLITLPLALLPSLR